MSDSWHPHGLLCPWDFPSKNAGLGCHFLLQGIFLTQGWNPHLLGRWILYHGATWADVTAETRRGAARGADGDIWLVSRLNSGPGAGLKQLQILRESGYPYAFYSSPYFFLFHSFSPPEIIKVLWVLIPIYHL